MGGCRVCGGPGAPRGGGGAVPGGRWRRAPPAGWASGLGRGEEAAAGPGQVPRGGGERGRALGGWDTGRVRSWRFPVPDLFNFPSHSCPESGDSGGSGFGSSLAALTAGAQTAGCSGRAEPRAPQTAIRLPKQTALRYLLPPPGHGSSERADASPPHRAAGEQPRRAAAAPRRRRRHHRHRHLPAGYALHGEPWGGRRERRPSLAESPEPPVPRAAPEPPGAP